MIQLWWKKIISSVSDPKKVTFLAVTAYFVCTSIAVILMAEESQWITRWFMPGVLLFGSVIATWSAWRGARLVELAALWPVSMGLLGGLIIEFDATISVRSHLVPYIAGMTLFTLLLVSLRVDFLVKGRGGSC